MFWIRNRRHTIARFNVERTVQFEAAHVRQIEYVNILTQPRLSPRRDLG
jgi:hypothetical protein